MKASDYIVEYFFRRGVKDFFGYQGTMIAHLIDSIGKNENVRNHCCYNEQGAAFAAVGAAKLTGECTVAYATSGPGAVNLISGIADAYYDSTPVVFLTGQLNTNEYTPFQGLRQQGFQETNVISMVESVTKYCCQVQDAKDLPGELEKAYHIAMEGRKGPVLLDLPMNVQRQEVDDAILPGKKMPIGHEEASNEKASSEQALGEKASSEKALSEQALSVIRELKIARRPILLLGNGLPKEEQSRLFIKRFIEKAGIPVITSMLGRDILAYDHPLNFGMIGSAYGHRYANLIAGQKADYILSIGCSMCPRQVGMHPENFAQGARIVRVDLDEEQLKRKVHASEKHIVADGFTFLKTLEEQWPCHNEIKEKDADKTGDVQAAGEENNLDFTQWAFVCKLCKKKLMEYDNDLPELRENRLVEQISSHIPSQAVICADVGQHQVWTATSFAFKEKQRFLCSGGHGAMGFSLPAGIGAYYEGEKPVYVLCGDGSLQMNIQELQWIKREQVPITIVVMNNASLGLIRQQQDSIFEGRYTGACVEGGYESPDFEKIAEAYGIDAVTIKADEIGNRKPEKWITDKPMLIQILMSDHTVAFPKTVFGEPMYNQKPYVPESIMEEILKL